MSLHDQRIPFHISMYVTVNTHVKGSKKMFYTSSSFMLWCLNVFLFLISLKRLHIFWPFTIFDHFASWYWHGSVWCSPIYFQRTREYSPQDILGFAYYRSLLQSTITIFGGTHRHAHTNTHAISRCFSLDFVHRHNGLRSEVCVCTGALCSVHIQLPLHSWPLPFPSRQLTTVRTGYCIQRLLIVIASRKLFTSPWYDTSFNPQGCTE